MHVLICSQNPVVADAVCRAFAEETPRLTVYASSLELLGAVRVVASDLVVLDLATPGLGGALLVSAIRELAPGVPIVAVSATPDLDPRAVSQQGVPVASLVAGPEGPALSLPVALARVGKAKPAVRAGTP